MWAWGNNTYGMLGDGTTKPRDTPTRVGTRTTWVTVSAGGRSTCGIRSGHTLWCWGYNGTGGLGDGTTISRYVPTRVGTAADWTAIDGGHEYAVGIRG